jgi:hypothetical protein
MPTNITAQWTEATRFRVTMNRRLVGVTLGPASENRLLTNFDSRGHRMTVAAGRCRASMSANGTGVGALPTNSPLCYIKDVMRPILPDSRRKSSGICPAPIGDLDVDHARSIQTNTRRSLGAGHPGGVRR